MFNRIRDRFGTAGLIVSIMALVLALAGGAFAAAGLNSKQKSQVRAIASSSQTAAGCPSSPRPPCASEAAPSAVSTPPLTIAVTPRAGDANISYISIAFPRSEFLENAHIRTICTRPDFAADRCPAGAVYGTASVTTPLLDYPLTGNVYLRSSDNLLPDVVPDLRGPAHQPLRLESAGRTHSIRGGIRNTLDFVPDAPFSRAVVSMQGGNQGLLVNSRDSAPAPTGRWSDTAPTTAAPTWSGRRCRCAARVESARPSGAGMSVGRRTARSHCAAR